MSFLLSFFSWFFLLLLFCVRLLYVTLCNPILEQCTLTLFPGRNSCARAQYLLHNNCGIDCISRLRSIQHFLLSLAQYYKFCFLSSEILCFGISECWSSFSIIDAQSSPFRKASGVFSGTLCRSWVFRAFVAVLCTVVPRNGACCESLHAIRNAVVIPAVHAGQAVPALKVNCHGGQAKQRQMSRMWNFPRRGRSARTRNLCSFSRNDGSWVKS